MKEPLKLPRFVKLLPAIFLGLLMIGFFFLGGISEPTRLGIWFGIQLILMILGPVIILGLLIYLLVRRRWKSRNVLTTGFVAIIASLFPHIIPSLVTYPQKLSKDLENLTIRSPLGVDSVIAWGGDTLKGNYHAGFPDQRWAYDILVEPAMNGSENLEDYGCYDKPVLAPVAGKVVSIKNDIPDQPPGIMPGFDTPATGNHVIIRPDGKAENRWLTIGHLKPGSVTVAVGDLLTSGQEIARCGNSGNSSEPHIHIHFAVHHGNDDIMATGLPLYFESPDGPVMLNGGLEVKGDDVILTGDRLSVP